MGTAGRGGRLLSRAGCGRALRLPWLLLLGWEPRGRARGCGTQGRWHCGDGIGGPSSSKQSSGSWILARAMFKPRAGALMCCRGSKVRGTSHPWGFICKPFPCSLSPLQPPLPMHPALQQPWGPGYLPCPYLLPFQPSRLGSCKVTTLPAARPCCVPGAHRGAVQLSRVSSFSFFSLFRRQSCDPWAAVTQGPPCQAPWLRGWVVSSRVRSPCRAAAGHLGADVPAAGLGPTSGLLR